jgi:hypothetical protein
VAAVADLKTESPDGGLFMRLARSMREDEVAAAGGSFSSMLIAESLRDAVSSELLGVDDEVKGYDGLPV